MAFYWLYLISFPLGVFLSSHLRLKRKYFWVEYTLFFFFPILIAYMIYTLDGPRIVWIAVAWVLFGPLLEAVIGYGFLAITKKHLWVYERMPILNRTTSWLVVPYWAIAGVGVWSLNEIIKKISF